MRFYSNDAEAEAASDNRACHRLLLAEWRDGLVEDPTPLARNSVHPEFRAHVPGLVARAALTARNMRGMAGDAVNTTSPLRRAGWRFSRGRESGTRR